MAFIGQCARSGEYLDDTDKAKEEEDHPDDLVTFEEIAYFYVHSLYMGLMGLMG
jgi:hypothetical protein